MCAVSTLKVQTAKQEVGDSNTVYGGENIFTWESEGVLEPQVDDRETAAFYTLGQ